MDVCKLISFNCKSVKRSAMCIKQLCNTADIIALQETWLLSHDIPFLGSIHDEFDYTGKSAVNVSRELLRGRPYGGVALLWRKNAFNSITVIDCVSARIGAVRFEIENRSFIVFSVYMPTQCIDNLPEFTECLSEISAIIESSEVESVFILGDFNSHPTELFETELASFCAEQTWLCADILKLGISSSEYTFVSDAHGSRRWLDHCVVTKSAWETITDIKVRYDVVWSDHHPLEVYCDLKLVCKKLLSSSTKVNRSVIWGERQEQQVNVYSGICNEGLSIIHFPASFTQCADRRCMDMSHRLEIDKLYNSVINILREGAMQSYVKKQVRKGSYLIGWNKHVSEAHKYARLKYQLWISIGRPSDGEYFEEMCESRKIFKAKLKWCQSHQDQIKMDIIASQRSAKNFSQFWKNINKLNLKSGLPASVAGVSEPKDIADLFKTHFSVQPNLKQQCAAQQQVIDTEDSQRAEYSVRISAKEVRSVIQGMSRGKSPGHDGLSIEHLQYAGPHLPRVLSMLYSLCISHAYLPHELMKTIVVPLVKNRTGDISDKCNYRPISLATIIAKVLDRLLDKYLTNHIHLHDGQFGFRPGLSTESAILSLKHTTRYYVDRRTPVYACFLDLSRAFDTVCYDVLWRKLHDTTLPKEICSVFEYWYNNQVNHVKWAGVLSGAYGLECGVRQGGVSSPQLFNLYVNELIDGLSRQPFGCYVDGVCVNNISYADDMVLLAPSISALRKLLQMCETFAASHGLQYNVKKSEFMVFAPKGKCPESLSPIMLDGTALKRVSQFKYLGHIVSENLSDEADIERERRALTVRANMLVRRFARCSNEVKITLFKAYCQSLYTSGLWTTYTQKSVNALRVQYNNAFRMLLGLPRFCSASGMFAEARTDGFAACRRKKIASLLTRVRGSPNSILGSISGKWDSPFIKHCVRIMTA